MAEHRLIHPDTELWKIDSHIGSGVFATKFIPRGSITWALDYLDLVLDPRKLRGMPAAYHPIVERWGFRDAKGRLVLCWDHGRFVNHSCDSTSLPLGSICEVAIRDIEASEQVTSDYVTLNLTRELTCRCGSPRCRGIMRPELLSRYAGAIDSAVREVVPLLGNVRQPVLEFMVADDQARFLAVMQGTLPPPSCLEVTGQVVSP